MLSAMPQGRDRQASTGSGLWLHHSAEEISNHTCKNLCSLETIKGEPGLTTRTSPYTQHEHRNSKRVRSQSSNQRSVHHAQVETWDLALSRNLLVHPDYKHFGCKAIQTPDLTVRRASLARTSINSLCFTCIIIRI